MLDVDVLVAVSEDEVLVRLLDLLPCLDLDSRTFSNQLVQALTSRLNCTIEAVIIHTEFIAQQVSDFKTKSGVFDEPARKRSKPSKPSRNIPSFITGGPAVAEASPPPLHSTSNSVTNSERDVAPPYSIEDAKKI